MGDRPLADDDLTRLDDIEELSRLPTDKDLGKLELTTLQYYLRETNPANGLVRDKTDAGAPCSIAAVGLFLATIPVLVERGVFSREFAPETALRTLRFFRDSPHGTEPDATGYKGFYYHFLDMKSGRRVWQCELSTIDSAFLFAGMLTCAAYFDRDTEEEAEVRQVADEVYRRADWQWALNGGAALSHGWKPESGFLPHYWTGYDEGLLLYILGLGSPTFRLPSESYAAIVRPTSGRRSMAANCFTPGRSSHISSRISGSTSAISATPSCASAAATTFRTAARRPTFTGSTAFAIRWSLPGMVNSAGASPRAMDRVGRGGR
jgi:hypothetical protein